jgi:hypothetical protein
MRRISESLSGQQGQIQRTPPPVEIAENSRDVEKLPRHGMHLQGFRGSRRHSFFDHVRIHNKTVFRMVLSFMPQSNERLHACGAQGGGQARQHGNSGQQRRQGAEEDRVRRRNLEECCRQDRYSVRKAVIGSTRPARRAGR